MKYELLELRSYMIDNDTGVYEMLQELPAVDEFDQHNEYFGLSKEDTKKLINKMMRHAYGFDNSQDYPRCDHFVLFVDGKPVSMGCLMLEMTDYWRKHRGYFWYKTRPTERKKGYGTKLLELIVDRAKELGYKELFSQCDINNYGSNKIMINNGFTTYINPLCPDWDDTNFYRRDI